MIAARILVFGDSIAEGFWDSRGGWVDRLKQDLLLYSPTNAKDRGYNNFYNLGVDANTTEHLLTRLQPESIARKADTRKSAYIMAIGTNDSRAEGESTNYFMEPEQFRKNIEELFKMMQRNTDKILFVGLVPVSEELTTPIYDDVWYTNERIFMFNTILSEFAAANNLPFVDIYSGMSKLDYKSMLQDGLHPNDSGHEWIAEQVKPVLKELLED